MALLTNQTFGILRFFFGTKVIVSEGCVLVGNNVYQFPGADDSGLKASQDASTSDTGCSFGGDDQAVRMKVSIRDLDTPVWRRLVVHSFGTLDDLAYAISLSFGWSGQALCYFKKDSTYYDCPDLLAKPRVPRHKGDVHLGMETEVADALTLGDTVLFVYDLEVDNWEVDVEVEGVIDLDTSFIPVTPLCIGGRGAGPFECVGGSYGWKDFLYHINNAGSAEFFDAREWAGIPYETTFDPEKFSLVDVNTAFIFDATMDQKVTPLPKSPQGLRDLSISLYSKLISMVTYAQMMHENLDPEHTYCHLEEEPSVTQMFFDPSQPHFDDVEMELIEGMLYGEDDLKD
ncbi:MAG: plasmid pRiA4b ORF-3 family protein [Eggerthellales bacterium]|nr:plasmid pRiA4b ORF-3 family protein [Eggerthellales bacterium]